MVDKSRIYNGNGNDTYPMVCNVSKYINTNVQISMFANTANSMYKSKFVFTLT